MSSTRRIPTGGTLLGHRSSEAVDKHKKKLLRVVHKQITRLHQKGSAQSGSSELDDLDDEDIEKGSDYDYLRHDPNGKPDRGPTSSEYSLTIASKGYPKHPPSTLKNQSELKLSKAGSSGSQPSSVSRKGRAMPNSLQSSSRHADSTLSIKSSNTNPSSTNSGISSQSSRIKTNTSSTNSGPFSQSNSNKTNPSSTNSGRRDTSSNKNSRHGPSSIRSNDPSLTKNGRSGPSSQVDGRHNPSSSTTSNPDSSSSINRRVDSSSTTNGKSGAGPSSGNERSNLQGPQESVPRARGRSRSHQPGEPLTPDASLFSVHHNQAQQPRGSRNSNAQSDADRSIIAETGPAVLLIIPILIILILFFLSFNVSKEKKLSENDLCLDDLLVGPVL